MRPEKSSTSSPARQKTRQVAKHASGRRKVPGLHKAWLPTAWRADVNHAARAGKHDAQVRKGCHTSQCVLLPFSWPCVLLGTQPSCAVLLCPPPRAGGLPCVSLEGNQPLGATLSYGRCIHPGARQLSRRRTPRRLLARSINAHNNWTLHAPSWHMIAPPSHGSFLSRSGDIETLHCSKPNAMLCDRGLIGGAVSRCS